MADQRHGERTMGGDRSLRGPWVRRLSPGSHGDKAFRYLLPVVVYGGPYRPGHQREVFREGEQNESENEMIRRFSALGQQH